MPLCVSMIWQLLQTQLFQYILTGTPCLKIVESSYGSVPWLMCWAKSNLNQPWMLLSLPRAVKESSKMCFQAASLLPVRIAFADPVLETWMLTVRKGHSTVSHSPDVTLQRKSLSGKSQKRDVSLPTSFNSLFIANIKTRPALGT